MSRPAMRATLFRGIVAMLFLFATVEIILRLRGWCDIPVYVADDRYEYMYSPDQDLHPGPLHIKTNSLGLRCGEPDRRARRRVLTIGDSVLNGTDRISNEQLATTIAEERVDHGSPGQVQILNVSASSWGPDNAAAWVRAHGILDADLIIAVFSSHDAQDCMSFKPLVGVHPAYPGHSPRLAWSRLFQRIPGFSPPMPPFPEGPCTFNPGWRELKTIADHAGIPLVVLLHPEREEVSAGNYDARGQQIMDSLSALGIMCTKGMAYMKPAFYADYIHVNEGGQAALAMALGDIIAAH